MKKIIVLLTIMSLLLIGGCFSSKETVSEDTKAVAQTVLADMLRFDDVAKRAVGVPANGIYYNDGTTVKYYSPTYLATLTPAEYTAVILAMNTANTAGRTSGFVLMGNALPYSGLGTYTGIESFSTPATTFVPANTVVTNVQTGTTQQADGEAVVLSIASVTAASGTLTVTMNVTPSAAPVIGDFTVTAAINGAAAATVTPTAIANTGVTVTLTVPVVAATSAEQTVVYTVAYKTTAAKSANLTVAALPYVALASVDAVTATTVEVTTTEAKATVPANAEFKVLVNNMENVVTNAVRKTGDTTNKKFTLTLTTTLANTEGSIKVNGIAKANITNSDYAFDFKVPVLESVTVTNSTQIVLNFSEKVKNIDTFVDADIELAYPANDAVFGQDKIQTNGGTAVASGKTIVVTLGQELVNGDYYVNIRANRVKDIADNAMAYTSKAFVAAGLADNKPTLSSAIYSNYSGILTLMFSEAIKNQDADVDETKITVKGANNVTYTLVDADYADVVQTDNKIVTADIKSKVTGLTQPFTVTLAADAVIDTTGNKNVADTVGKAATHFNAPTITSATLDEKAKTLTIVFDQDVDKLIGATAAGATLKLTGAVTAGVETTYVDDGTVFDLTGKDTNVDGKTQVFTITGTAAFVNEKAITLAKVSLPVDFVISKTKADGDTIKSNVITDAALTYTDDTTGPKYTAKYNSLTKVLTIEFDEEIGTAANVYAPLALGANAATAMTNLKYSVNADGSESTDIANADGINVAKNGNVYTFTFTAPKAEFDAPSGAKRYIVLNDDNIKDSVGQKVSPKIVEVYYTDLIPPKAHVVNLAGADAAAAINKNEIRVKFDEKVEKTTAETAGNYSLYAKLNPTQTVAVTKATLLADQQTVILTTADQLSILYTLEIINVKDISTDNNGSGNAIIANVTADQTAAGPSVYGSKLTEISGSGAALTKIAIDGNPLFDDKDNSGTVNAGDTVTITFTGEIATGTYSASDLVLDKNGGADVSFGTGTTVVRKADDVKKVVVTFGSGATIVPGTTKIGVSSTSTIKDAAGRALDTTTAVVDNNSSTGATISTAVFEDVNADGKAGAGDTIALTFDRPIADIVYDAADNTDALKQTALAKTFKYNKDDNTDYDDAFPTDTKAVKTSDTVITITLGGDLASTGAMFSQVRWTGSVTKVAYVTGAAAGQKAQVKNKWGTENLTTAKELSKPETVGPKIESVTYYDTSALGVPGDTVIIDFDQPLSIGAVQEKDFAMTNIDFDTASSDGTASIGTVVLNGDKLTVTLGNNAAVTPGAKLNIAGGDAAFNIFDVYGNKATASTAAHDVTIANDTTRPTLNSAVYTDVNANGLIDATDTIKFTFSEAVTIVGTQDTLGKLAFNVFGLGAGVNDTTFGTAATAFNQLTAFNVAKTEMTVTLDASPTATAATVFNPVNAVITDLAGNQDNTVFTVNFSSASANAGMFTATNKAGTDAAPSMVVTITANAPTGTYKLYSATSGGTAVAEKAHTLGTATTWTLTAGENTAYGAINGTKKMVYTHTPTAGTESARIDDGVMPMAPVAADLGRLSVTADKKITNTHATEALSLTANDKFVLYENVGAGFVLADNTGDISLAGNAVAGTASARANDTVYALTNAIAYAVVNTNGNTSALSASETLTFLTNVQVVDADAAASPVTLAAADTIVYTFSANVTRNGTVAQFSAAMLAGFVDTDANDTFDAAVAATVNTATAVAVTTAITFTVADSDYAGKTITNTDTMNFTNTAAREVIDANGNVTFPKAAPVAITVE